MGPFLHVMSRSAPGFCSLPFSLLHSLTNYFHNLNYWWWLSLYRVASWSTVQTITLLYPGIMEQGCRQDVNYYGHIVVIIIIMTLTQYVNQKLQSYLFQVSQVHDNNFPWFSLSTSLCHHAEWCQCEIKQPKAQKVNWSEIHRIY